ncbi:unnamed protein product [Chilo suppressalis]|uniref:glutathione transferase n=1 Tax=Chilo suppressalis TaxID=168631 RepID=A0ABN8L216_CHISP|nr:unnamed protein product [Chilo suppressalis]
MAKKLQYFNVNGRGEAIRYMLHYGGHKFEDIRYEVKDWPIQSVKDSLPYGQFPLYEEDGKTLNQSLAIARYVASQSQLLPSDLWQQAVLDAVVHNIYDFWNKNKLAEYMRGDAETRAALKKQTFEEHIPFYLPRFEKELKANNGHFAGKLYLMVSCLYMKKGGRLLTSLWPLHATSPASRNCCLLTFGSRQFWMRWSTTFMTSGIRTN